MNKIIVAVLLLFVACAMALEKRDINFGEVSGQTPSFLVHGKNCQDFVPRGSIDGANGKFTAAIFEYSPSTSCGVPYKVRFKPWNAVADDHTVHATCFTEKEGARIHLSIVTDDGDSSEDFEKTFFVNAWEVDQDGEEHLVKISYTATCGNSRAGRCFDYKIQACCVETLCGPAVQECKAVPALYKKHKHAVKGGFIYNYKSVGFNDGLNHHGKPSYHKSWKRGISGDLSASFPVPENACTKESDSGMKRNPASGSHSSWGAHSGFGGFAAQGPFGAFGSHYGNGKCCYGVTPGTCNSYCSGSPVDSSLTQGHHYGYKGHKGHAPVHTGDWYPSTTSK